MLSPSAGVWLVCVDRRPSASLGGCATTRGRHPHHVCHRLVHRVCQQHCHYYHLSACLGRAGKVIPWQDQLVLCTPPLGGQVCVGFVLGQALGSSPAPGLFKTLGSSKSCSITWTLKDNNPSDFVVRDVIIYHRVWDRALHTPLAICSL